MTRGTLSDGPKAVLSYPNASAPEAFTQDQLGWLPWLQPLEREHLEERHWEALSDHRKANSDYYMLLARDPKVLFARTQMNIDIFRNSDAGLPREERELCAAATSRLNGCIYCASVHARFASHFSRQSHEVQRLLDHGIGAQQAARWQALIDFAVALTRTPVAVDARRLGELRAVGLDDLSILDALQGTAFFNWANRLMLSLGQPTSPPAQ